MDDVPTLKGPLLACQKCKDCKDDGKWISSAIHHSCLASDMAIQSGKLIWFPLQSDIVRWAAGALSVFSASADLHSVKRPRFWIDFHIFVFPLFVLFNNGLSHLSMATLQVNVTMLFCLQVKTPNIMAFLPGRQGHLSGANGITQAILNCESEQRKQQNCFYNYT